MTLDMPHKIMEHYNHAKEAHPKFCDALVATHSPSWWEGKLGFCREILSGEVKKKHVTAETVLLCEVAEIFAALQQFNIPGAIEECYDAIAVLMRIVEELKSGSGLEIDG